MRALLIASFLTVVVASPSSHGQELLTGYERSGYRQTPRYAETVDFCRKLAEASEFVSYTTFGVSPQGRDLPLLIVDKSMRFEPVDDDRVKLMVFACIHAGESDGKDAGLMLVRDFVRDGKLSSEFDNVVLLFVPIFNVDGHEKFSPYNRINQAGPEEMGYRVTAQGYNLNRDFIKADAPEMRFWLRLFNEWLPDMFVDIHVTDGADYQYVVTYGIETHENLVEPVRTWIDEDFLPNINERMSSHGFPLIPYVITRDYQHITNGLIGIMWSPRYSTGYGTIQNRPAMLVETHMLKDYQTRVEGTYTLLQELIGHLDQNATELTEAVDIADLEVARNLAGTYYTVAYDRTKDTTEMLSFKGVSVTVRESDISGGEWVIWENEPRDYTVPYLSEYEPSDSVVIPEAYIIPPEWADEIEVLAAHGVQIERLDGAHTLDVRTYRFDDVEWYDEPYEGHMMVSGFEMEDVSVTKTFPDNSAVIVMNQRANQVAIHLLEPEARDSFIRWGFFSTIFGQKEYFESYVMEQIAREMLNDNPELRIEFDSILSSDTTFAASPRARLQFFYERSPYWDADINLYPVGRLHDTPELKLR